MHKTKISALIALLVIGFVISITPVAIAGKPPSLKPMIFVHGGAGSGAQFESQAMRFTANGYPANYIAVHEYDSSLTIENMIVILARLEVLIANILEETGADKVDLIGHSFGGLVELLYMETPERAAKVARCVILDSHSSLGRSAPEGVPTLAIWGMGSPDRQIPGATNVYYFDLTHVQLATSAEAFVEMYKFFTGEEPEEKHIVPEHGQISLAGRAVIFPINIWVGTATLEIWKVNSDTGTRTGKKPEAIYPISGDGAWGPFMAKAGAHYEFALLREDYAPHHFYREPFIRSNYLIRLLTSLDGIAAYANRSDYHSNLLILRYKEFWGDQSVNNDILEINGVNVVTADICPLIKRVNGIWVYDKDSDGLSDLTEPIPYYFMQPFQTGVDLYIPAATPPTGTISIVSISRGISGNSRVVINVPNWASSTDRITVQFNDYHLVE